MADPIREALKRLLAVIKPKYTNPDEIVAVVRAMAAARTALAAEPPAPTPAADPLPGFAATLIASQRPMDPDVAAALTPEARWEMYGGAPAPAADGERDHVPDAGNMVAADGEAEELATLLAIGSSCAAGAKLSPEQCRRAAALLREARSQPVPVADRPWKRPGWCDAEGRCWWFAPTEAISGGFRCAGWSLYAADPADEDTHCLPHWAIAIPQPPQANTTHPTPTENDGTD